MSHWVPTHVQVTVVRAKSLIPKSKNGGEYSNFVNSTVGSLIIVIVRLCTGYASELTAIMTWNVDFFSL